jgi:hypothetical protein
MGLMDRMNRRRGGGASMSPILWRLCLTDRDFPVHFCERSGVISYALSGTIVEGCSQGVKSGAALTSEEI